MRPVPPAAAAVLLLLAAAARADEQWVTVRNEMGTVEIQAPPGFKEPERKHPSLHIFLQYSGEPFKSAFIRVYAHQGYKKAENVVEFMKFVEKDVGGTPSYEEGSTTRFTTDKQGSDGSWWVCLAEGRVVGGYGIYVLAQVPRDVYEGTKDTWFKVLDSFKTAEPAPETFEVPATWKVVRNDMYAVLGPVAEIKDPKVRQQLENRLFRVQTWLDPVTSASVKMFRDLTSDTRRYVPKLVVHVLPTTEAFRKAAGESLREGASAVYLPDHKDRVVLVDGSPDSPVQEADLVAEAGVQYMEARIGRMKPWMRAAFGPYFGNGFQRKCMAGLFPEEFKKRAKEVFGKNPPPFEELMKKDEKGIRELGEDGRVACWGILQFGLHGPDGGIHNLFSRFLRESVGAPDQDKVWEKAIATYKEETKKTFKPRDVDSGARKWFREMKEEKR